MISKAVSSFIHLNIVSKIIQALFKLIFKWFQFFIYKTSRNLFYFTTYFLNLQTFQHFRSDSQRFSDCDKNLIILVCYIIFNPIVFPINFNNKSMSSNRSASVSRKKGLKVSLIQQNSKSLQKRVQASASSKQNMDIHHTPLIGHHPVHSPNPNFVTVQVRPQTRPPVIVYRYRKSEWQLLQQSNKNKRQTVEKMKAELQNLNKEVYTHQWKQNERICRSIPLSPVDKKSLEIRMKICPRVETPKVTMFNPLQLQNHNVIIEKRQSSKHAKCLRVVPQQNIKNIFVSSASFNKQKISSEHAISREVTKQVQNLEAYSGFNEKDRMNLEQKGEEEERKYQPKGRRKHIDLNSLVQIQNRLNHLINFTSF